MCEPDVPQPQPVAAPPKQSVQTPVNSAESFRIRNESRAAIANARGQRSFRINLKRKSAA